MSIYTLSNGHLSLTVKHKGAEITSIKTADGMEFMWQPQGSIYWQRQSPLLFPVIGKLKENQCFVNGVRHPMTQHGFVRDVDFDWIGKTDTQLTYWIKDSTETQKQYPSKFELKVIYTLIENKISVRFWVKNTGPDPMWFSIGGHPAFKCPMREGDIFADYYLEFEKAETGVRHFLETGLLSDKTQVVFENTNKMPLHPDMFREDAFVFQNLESKKVTRKSQNHDRSIGIEFSQFPYLGVWTQSGAPFVCLEPWTGLADTVNASGDIRDKVGIRSLEPGKKCEFEYFIVVN